MTKTAMIECPSCAGNGGMGVYCEECECTGQVSVPANVAEHLAWLEKQAAALDAMTDRVGVAEATLTAIPWTALDRYLFGEADLSDINIATRWVLDNHPRKQESQP